MINPKKERNVHHSFTKGIQTGNDIQKLIVRLTKWQCLNYYFINSLIQINCLGKI